MDKIMAKREPWVPLLKSYPESEKINRVSIGAECLFVRLLAKCDDQGSYYAEPNLLTFQLFAHRLRNRTVTVPKTARYRDELKEAGLITLYEVGGEQYLNIPNPRRLVRPDVKEDVVFPSPDEADTAPGRERNGNGPLEKKRKEKKKTDYTEDFEEVWAQYPPPNARKGSKVGARKKYDGMRDSGVSREQALAAIEGYKSHLEAERRGGFADLKTMNVARFFGPAKEYQRFLPTKDESGVAKALALFGDKGSETVRQDIKRYATSNKSDTAFSTLKSHIDSANFEKHTVDAKAVREALK